MASKDYFSKYSFDYDKRISELDRAIKKFIEYHSKKGEEIRFIEDANEIITVFYFRWLSENVKPLIPKKVNRYKMAALTALSIIKIQPILEEDVVKRKKYNAEFAFYTCIALILSMTVEDSKLLDDLDSFVKDTAISRIEMVFETSKKQTLEWMIAKNPNSMPVFTYGSSLFVLFELYRHRFQSLMSP